ncbi:hypothetical protein R1sor_002090 [Riccia sorocarpa]|uniref:Secreted protein n=1 Tax=Riccia sorocarpa TaxID=122646 RepID=A0ABD3GYL4_9MARC
MKLLSYNVKRTICIFLVAGSKAIIPKNTVHIYNQARGFWNVVWRILLVQKKGVASDKCFKKFGLCCRGVHYLFYRCSANSLTENVPKPEGYAIYRAVACSQGTRTTELPSIMKDRKKKTWSEPGEEFLGFKEG